jgi:hypothetical protein
MLMQFKFGPGFIMNFELLPILTDYANWKKGGMEFKKFFLNAVGASLSKCFWHRL